ncbi:MULTISPECIES: hypothetical protein [Oscillatoriales]|uniref:hypothetical protein n=1 Tax=Oscillatoriophycideae TaxID=1301283 RepID=UPI0016889984|nr:MULTISPECIES: hypothetical protein [Oscillatoriales]
MIQVDEFIYGKLSVVSCQSSVVSCSVSESPTSFERRCATDFYGNLINRHLLQKNLKGRQDAYPTRIFGDV